MKIKIHKSTLSAALTQVSGIVPNNSTLPILSNVLIEADGSSLKLSTTDLDRCATKRIEAGIEQPGKVTLPVKCLSAIVRELPTEEISIEVSAQNIATIRSGPSVFKINGLPANEFPEMGYVKEGQKLHINQADLKAALDKTVYAISFDETRYILNGIYFEAKRSQLTLVSTDGRRLALLNCDAAEPVAFEKCFIIPRNTIDELRKALGQSGVGGLIVSDSMACFEINNLALTTKLIEGNYPNFRQVIPASSKYRAKVERESFLSALKRVALLVNERTNSLKLTFGDNRISISSNSPDIGESEESVDAIYDGPEITMGLNPEYLSACLRALPNDQVFIDLSDSDSPAVIRVESPESFIYVIMPMRVAN
jgi:DNA polymerase III subunit beta